VSYTIERLGHLGEGIAPGPIYVPLALPGEVVDGTLEGNRLTNLRIVTPSPDRVKPPCPHYRACGGCSLQHAADSFVADWKVEVVRKALTAHHIAFPEPEIYTTAAATRRRATLTGKRTKSGAMVGFHKRASDILIEIPGCILLHPDLMSALPALQDLTIIGASRKAELALAVTRSDAGIDVAVTGGKPLDGALRVALAAWVERYGMARLTWDDEQVAERTPPHQTFGQTRVTPPPGAFLQATETGQNALVRAALSAIGDAKRVVDLFSGCGTFTLPIAEFAEVHAVEGDAAMLAALDKGWRRGTELHRVTTETRDLFRRPVLAAEFKGFDAAVIDPPRAGAEAQTTEIAASDLARIVFVSCNPVTFARDARILTEAGFTITALSVVDQFRWSPHVELVAAFSR